MDWCRLPHKGLGVELYLEYTPANTWVRTHKGLSCSEWRESLKMLANVSPVPSVPGRSMDNNLCRRCHREKESLAHVLGSCPHGELLRNCRHHQVRSFISDELRKKDFTVYEEVHGLATDGSSRRIDIIAFKANDSKGYILDPTIRWEHHIGQPEEVHEEKKTIYEPTVSYYKTKYKLQEIEVLGLMVGA